LIGIGGTFLLVLLVGGIASWDILRKKPLGILRSGD
jgi:putative ABC transport system permease protein